MLLQEIKKGRRKLGEYVYFNFLRNIMQELRQAGEVKLLFNTV